jgi:hypothetical protein
MVPQHFRFGGGATETTIYPVAVVCLLIAITLMWAFPRGKAVIPFLAAFFTIPISQVVLLGGFHFTICRILVLAGLVRRATFRGPSSRGEYPGGFKGVDLMVILWSVFALITFCLQFMESQAFINGVGNLLDVLGGYMVMRFLIPDGSAMRRAIKTLAVICVIQGICMINEEITSFNVFGYLGGSSWVIVREGRIRAAGSLGALSAGPFGGVLIPVFLWLLTQRKLRTTAWAGMAGATAMVITSNSSTSWMALGGSLIGLAFWPLREQMRLVRRSLVAILVGLHLVMKAPVWALVARIDLTGSSSGYQRFVLVDMTIRHFSDWWLMGTPNYVNWGWDTYDLCNQFVAIALTGGLLPLIFYIAIFKKSFASIGKTRKLVRGNRDQEWLLWCMGSALFGTVVSHWGINYVGVLLMSLFVLLTFILVTTFETRQTSLRNVDDPFVEQPIARAIPAWDGPPPSEPKRPNVESFRM